MTSKKFRAVFNASILIKWKKEVIEYLSLNQLLLKGENLLIDLLERYLVGLIFLPKPLTWKSMPLLMHLAKHMVQLSISEFEWVKRFLYLFKLQNLG